MGCSPSEPDWGRRVSEVIGRSASLADLTCMHIGHCRSLVYIPVNGCNQQ